MTIFQNILFYCYSKNRPLKTIIVVIIILCCLFNLSAQEDSNIQLKIESGILWTSESANPGFPWFNGFFLLVEPKVKTSLNTFIGLRFGIAVNEQKNEKFDLTQFYNYNNPDDGGLIDFTNPDNGIFSIVPTVDYYFIEKKNHPYLGVGIGYYFLMNYTHITPRGIANPSEAVFRGNVKNQIGVLFRGGLKLHKLIIGLEMNYIPKVEMEIPNGQIIRKINNSYIGMSIGYAIGIGKQ